MKQGWSSFMDRRVKERLIGATILVVLIVLIVPELLSGPTQPPKTAAPLVVGPAEPVRNVTVDLATSKATPADDAPGSAVTPGAAAQSALSDGSASGEPDAASVRRPAAPPTITTLQAQQPIAPALENDVSSPKSVVAMPKSGASNESGPPDTAHHNWAVQLGSFASSENAEKLQHRLKAQNYSAYVLSSGTGKSQRYRVRVGPLADRAAAERVLARLRKEGHSGSLVAP